MRRNKAFFRKQTSLAMQVIWNKKAIEQLDEILEFSRKEFGERIAQKLYVHFMNYDSLLTHNPLLGIVEPLLLNRKLTYRSIVIHKRFKMVYYFRESSQSLHIAAIWDTRREPRNQARNLK